MSKRGSFSTRKRRTVEPRASNNARMLILAPFTLGLAMMGIHLWMKYARLDGADSFDPGPFVYAVGMIGTLFGIIPVAMLVVGLAWDKAGWRLETAVFRLSIGSGTI